MHDGEGKGGLLAYKVEELVLVQGDKASVILCGNGFGGAGGGIHQGHLTEEFPRLEGGKGDIPSHLPGGELHLSGVDDIHLASGGIFLEDNLGFLVGLDELPKSTCILHDPNIRKTCDASCGHTNRLWNNAFRKKYKKVQSADGSAVNLNWKQTIESLQHLLRWFSFRARDERNYL